MTQGTMPNSMMNLMNLMKNMKKEVASPILNQAWSRKKLTFILMIMSQNSHEWMF